MLDNQSAVCRNCGAPGSAGTYRPRRSARIAVALSIIPGLGHLYLGHTFKGLFYMFGATGLELIGFDLDLTVVGAALGIPAGLGGFGLWAHGVYDAYRTAKRMEADGTL